MRARIEECGQAVERGVEFLERRQEPSGAFGMQYTFLEWVDPQTGLPGVGDDPSPFVTAYIVHSLGYCNHPAARRMIAASIRYFRDQELPGGMWRYWNKGTAPLGDIPPDVDDTASISELLERFGSRTTDNKWLLLLNRDSRNRFYTWLTPRFGPGFNWRYWSTILPDVTFARIVLVWRRTPCRRGDVDAVVNANVAYYLGPVPETEPVMDYLLEIVRDGKEDSSDKWYPDMNTFYYAVSRCYARGMTRLFEATQPMLARFSRRSAADGSIGGSDLLTALAVGAILNFKLETELLAPAIDYLLATQQDDGGWTPQTFYTNGTRPARVVWSSRDLTTALCLEAIERFSREAQSA